MSYKEYHSTILKVPKKENKIFYKILNSEDQRSDGMFSAVWCESTLQNRLKPGLCFKPYSKRQILDSAKLNELQMTILNLMKVAECSFLRVENSVGKVEIARNEQFILFPHCFQKTSLQTRENQGLLGTGIRVQISSEPLLIKDKKVSPWSVSVEGWVVCYERPILWTKGWYFIFVLVWERERERQREREREQLGKGTLD